MSEHTKIPYSDCYQGLLKYIIEQKGLNPAYMNLLSWGFSSSKVGSIDIPFNDFQSILNNFYGLKELKKVYYPPLETCISLIKEAFEKKAIPFIKVHISVCNWNSFSDNTDVFHFLLIEDFIDDDIIKCYDIFYGDQTFTLKLSDIDLAKVRKVFVYESKDVNIENPKDFYKSYILNKYTDQYIDTNIDFLKNFINSKEFKEMFFTQDMTYRSLSQLALNRLVFVRTDLLSIFEEDFKLNEELILKWNEIIKDYKKLKNLLLKCMISPDKSNSFFDKANEIFGHILLIEPDLIRKSIEAIRNN